MDLEVLGNMNPEVVGNMFNPQKVPKRRVFE